MKVLILHNILWTHYKSVLFEEIYKKAPSGVEVMVLQIARNEISRKEMETGKAAPVWNYKYHLLFDDYFENIPSFSKIIAVSKYIIRHKPDVINIGGYGIDISITWSIVLSRLLGIKIIISSESTSQDQARSGIKEFIKRKLIAFADGFFCFGKRSRDYLIELGAKPDQIYEDAAAVVDDQTIRLKFREAEGFNHPSVQKKKNFIFVGRLIDVKNIPLLLEAFATLKRTVTSSNDWGLILLGNGEEKEASVAYVGENNLQDVAFVPSMPWYEIPKLFRVSDTLILPSFSETWGLVVNEAMICGLSVIVSDQCGCAPDLVKPGENGFIFPSGDAQRLVECMTAMVENEAQTAAMGRKSEEIVKKFNVASVAERMIRSFITLAKK